MKMIEDQMKTIREKEKREEDKTTPSADILSLPCENENKGKR